MRLGSLAALPTALVLCSCGGLQGTAPSTAYTESAGTPTATTSPELEEPASDVISLTLPDGRGSSFAFPPTSMCPRTPPLRLALADWGGPPVSITLEGEDAAVELLGHGWCPPPGGDDVDPADGYVFWCPQGTGRRFGISATGSATVLERLTAGLDLRICSHTATRDTRQCKS